ncbi:MAG: RrF2 family transcriptional regulator [Planctomycetota bacterium]|jgi:Rrf2 family protein
MFRISRKADYAVLIMCQLALRERALRAEEKVANDAALPPISAQEIATDGQLTRALTANIMKLLTRHGLLESLRGVSGGYRLAGEPADFTLAQILTAVEGPLALVDCAAHLSFDKPPRTTQSQDCALTECCPSRRAMHVVHQRIARLFGEITLAELIEMDANTPDLVGFGKSQSHTQP